jgi:hypothetical protein
VVKSDQTSVFGQFYSSEQMKKQGDRYKGIPASSHQMRYNMETVLIVLLVLFLLGGGGFGYSRWRR